MADIYSNVPLCVTCDSDTLAAVSSSQDDPSQDVHLLLPAL